MSQVSNAKLELVLQQDGNVDVKVSYDARFSTSERHWSGLGLIFLERILVFGVDVTESELLTTFIPLSLPVTDGDVPQIITRQRSSTVPRDVLNEDAFGADQIRCEIRIEPRNFPPRIGRALTNTVELNA